MDSTHFNPGSELTFKSVIQVREKMYKALIKSAHYDFCVDLGHVIYCDSAGLALLIEARRLCNHYNKQLKLVGASPAIQSLAEFCGVKSILKTN